MGMLHYEEWHLVPLRRMAFGPRHLLDGSSHRSLLDQNSWDLRSSIWQKFNQGGKKKTADKISLQIFFPHITSVHFLLMSFFLLLHFYVFICTHATLCTILPHTHNFEIPTSIPPPAISITCSETRHPILSSSSRMFFCLDSLHLLIES